MRSPIFLLLAILGFASGASYRPEGSLNQTSIAETHAQLVEYAIKKHETDLLNLLIDTNGEFFKDVSNSFDYSLQEVFPLRALDAFSTPSGPNISVFGQFYNDETFEAQMEPRRESPTGYIVTSGRILPDWGI